MRGKQMRKGLLVGVFLVISLWLLSLIWGLVGKAQIAVSEAHNAQSAFQALEERRQTLEANIAAFATPQGQDAAIRTAFGVARPGEEVIVVVPPATATATTTIPWWQMVLNWFR